jgi:hypothetical protein
VRRFQAVGVLTLRLGWLWRESRPVSEKLRVVWCWLITYISRENYKLEPNGPRLPAINVDGAIVLNTADNPDGFTVREYGDCRVGQ